MKEFIYKQLLNIIKNINSINDLIDSLEKPDKETFFKELMKKCKFIKKENNRINLLCEFYEKIEKISGDIETTLNAIISDINREEIENKIRRFFRK